MEEDKRVMSQKQLQRYQLMVLVEAGRNCRHLSGGSHETVRLEWAERPEDSPFGENALRFPLAVLPA